MLALGFTGRPGWVEVTEPNLDARAWINVAEEGGRYRIRAMLVGGRQLDTAIMRQIPLSRVESLLNQPGVGAGICSAAAVAGAVADRVGPDLRTYTDEFADIELALTTLLAAPPLGPALPPDGVAEERVPLQRPTGSDPEGFYRQVANAYSALIRLEGTARPAKVLAAEAGVPVATVHRWIHEARRRGFLPPARQGRAG